MSRPKVLVIGLDGTPFSLLDPWVADGSLPTLGALMESGTRRVLRSTIPYISAPAWTSFITGRNPGKHGVFDFVNREPGGYGVRLNNAATIRAKTLWSYLSEAGMRIGALNVPMTFPPQEVNGLLVGGLLTPSLQSRFTYPDGLREELLAAVPGYVIEPFEPSKDILRTKRELARNATVSSEKRTLAAQWLMKRLGDWDCFTCVYVAPDRLHHYFWADFDPRHPRHHAMESEFRTVLHDYYRALDGMLARLIEAAGPNTTVHVISDHGSAGSDQLLLPNQWLEEAGYLVTHGRRARTIKELKTLAGRLGIAHPLKKLLRKFFKEWGFSSQLRQRAFSADVDWTRTRAFWSADSALSINLRGREAGGIVPPEEYEALRTELIERLHGITVPGTGERVIERVYRREEIFSGPYLAQAGDLQVLWRYDATRGLTYGPSEELLGETIFDTDVLSGRHTIDGILISAGPDVLRTAALPDASLMDIAPTILHQLGLDVPADMDGRVLLDQLAGSSARPPRYVDTQPDATAEPAAGPGYSASEQELIEERLRALGYIE